MYGLGQLEKRIGSDSESNILSRVWGYVVLGREFENQMLSDNLTNISTPMITHIF